MKKLLLVVFIIILIQPIVSGAEMLLTRSQLTSAAQHQMEFNSTKDDTLRIRDTVWSEFVNRSVLQVSMDAGVILEEKSITISDGTRAYLIDSDIIKAPLWAARVEGNVIVPLKHIPMQYGEDLGYDTLGSYADHPGFYWMHGDSVHFFPTPATTDTIQIGYQVYASHLDSAVDSTNIPLEYREAVVLYTCYLAKARMGMYEEANWYLSQYRQKIGDYISAETSRFDVVKNE